MGKNRDYGALHQIGEKRAACRIPRSLVQLDDVLSSFAFLAVDRHLTGISNPEREHHSSFRPPSLLRSLVCPDDSRILRRYELDMKEMTLNRTVRQIFPTVEWVLLLILLWLFVGRALVPGWRILNTDFPNYYLAAVLRCQRHSLDRTYEWTWFQRQKDHNDISQPQMECSAGRAGCGRDNRPHSSLPP